MTAVSRWRRIGMEAGGVAIALGMATIALAHLLGTERASFVLSGGDSVFLEFVWRALRDGTNHQWSLSAVLFLFPELPMYLALRLPTDLPQQAIIANALLSAVLLYALLRAIVALLKPARAPILIALAVFAVMAACVLTESTGRYESFELVSFFFAGTFYYGTTLAIFAGVALVAVLVRDGTTRPARILAFVGLGLMSVLCTLSNPLYIVWAGAPICLALAVVAWRGGVTWRRALSVAAVLVASSGLGMLLRLPFGAFASPVAQSYIYPGRSVDSVLYYGWQAVRLTGSPPGVVELLLLAGLCAAAVAAFVLALRRPGVLQLLVASTGLAAPLVVFLFNVALGTESVRYLQPLYFAPLLSLTVLGALAAGRTRTAASPLPRPLLAVAAAVAVVAISIGSGASAVRLSAIGSAPYERVQCLEEWLDGRQLTGAGTFWGTRDLQAYGSENVQIAQVLEDFRTFPWMVDLSRYYEADVTYVVTTDEWESDATDLLGEPSEVIECGSYDILDYAGAPGQQLLTATVNDTAIRYAIEQGLR